jgi:hypothetical protein
MAMAMSPSRLDPPRAAILPTATLGNNNRVLIARMAMDMPKRIMPFGQKIAKQHSARIPVTTGRLHRPSQRKQRIKPLVMVAKELGGDDFHVVPFFNPEDWDDVEVTAVQLVHCESAARP